MFLNLFRKLLSVLFSLNKKLIIDYQYEKEVNLRF